MQTPSSLPPWDTHEPQSTLLSTTPSETHEKHGSLRSLNQDRNNTKRRQKHAVKTGDTNKVATEDAQLVKDDLAIMQHQESPFMSNKTEYLAKAIEQHDNRARIERSDISNLILSNIKSQENILEGKSARHDNLVKTNLNSHSSLILNQAKSNEDSGKRFYDEMGKLVDSEKRFYDEMGKLVRKVKSSAGFEVIDPMIKFLLHANDDANPDEFLDVVRSNFSFVSGEQFFLRIADLVDLETDPVEGCKYKTLAGSLVSAFFKLGLFAFPDDDVCDSIDGEDAAAAAAATGHLSNNLFVDNISHSIDSDSTNARKFFTPKKRRMRLDDNDGEIEKTAAEHLLLFSASQSRSEPLLPSKQEEVVSTGASAQSEKNSVDVQEIPILRQHSPQVEGTIGRVSQPTFPPTSSYSLLEFLVMKKDCLKVTPDKFHAWLVEQDIVSMDDLIDACNDEDFDTDEMRNGGLKAFKLKGFIKAVTS
ncbi:hypothetical protein FRACYDRAFT_233815 [Fragilariopsis cylindrus CCMP1102]|uniref:Uncharacterized protein n=1 Tax=Fragilariopsis cylindrus CCMP1102 TaxID=635003 RepID=A0A1E7G0B0_9STRA|nr:hypothetical protein FRACYDRAFT_233815 [Fragilariopsis cylindrus CCMP1102]|eukprot:OEU23643.1 hypothetical protein FRACYDRAFT_233815 [Fragilariopsis cylindrus CCMP1102]